MEVYYAGGLILGAVLWVLCAYYCYQVAPRFHRRPRNWAILGIVFGPIALMATATTRSPCRAASTWTGQ